MSLYFRPIIPEDKKIMTSGPLSHITKTPIGSLSESSGMQVGTVNAPEVFGVTSDHQKDKEYVYDDEFTRVGYIDLQEKIINPFLAGRNHTAWSILTGLPSSMIQEIVRYNLVYDLHDNEWKSIESVRDEKYHKDRFLLGVDAILHELDSVDFRQRIDDYIYANFLKKLEKKTGIKDLTRCVEFIKDETFEIMQDPESYKFPVFHIRNGYVLNLRNIADELVDETGEIPEPLIDIFYDFSNMWDEELVSETPDQFNVIGLLHEALTNGTERLIKSQIMTYLFILPKGYRPELSIGQNKLTVLYNDIVRLNGNVADIKRRNDNNMHSITRPLRELYDAIVKLMVNKRESDKTSIERKKDKDYKSLAETLKGKQGFIRDRLEGARIDFSGRTVISLDPYLPIDTIGVPIKILEKVANPIIVRRFIKESKNRPELKRHANMTDFHNQKDAGKYGISYIDFLKEVFQTNDIYGLIGRQPTLFYLGIQGFKIRPIDGDAITLSPLIVMPFNADFDGDQMHFSMPVTEEGLKDVKNKMLFKDNIWYPKNGDITVVVRHEIKYGLWECVTRKPNGNHSGCRSRKDCYDKVLSGEISVEDTYGDSTAGIAAFNYCLFGSNMEEQFTVNDILKVYNTKLNDSGDLTIKSLNHSKLTKLMFKVGGGREGFFNSINKLVALGFAVSKYYPPSISVLTDEKTKLFVREKIAEFNKRISEYKTYVDLGIELESNYNLYFSNECTKLTKEIKEYLLTNMDEDNGYWRMVVSGAKGDDDNLLQIYGIKGQVKKNAIEAFNTTVDGNYSEQLTGLEHFITAYGSRKGITDKTLSTATPGYMSRKLEHAGAPLKITTYDCWHGIPDEAPALQFLPEDVIPHIDYKYLSRNGMYPENRPGMSREDMELNAEEFYSNQSVYIQIEQAADYLAKILVGRHVVDGANNNLFIGSEGEALAYINKQWNKNKREGKFGPEFKPVKMRSPMTCVNPCCKVCYGIDLTKGAPGNADSPRILPKEGRKVGFIAAQAIGEPGTQLVMKNFQSGGIVGKTNITSSFDIIESCFDLKNYSKDVASNGVILYDPVAPVTGYVKKINMGQNKSQIIITRTNSINDRDNIMNKKLFVNNSVELKKFVRRGDTMCFSRGNVNIRDIIKYDCYDNGCKQLLLTLYSTFKEQDVWSVHFECIIRNMMQYTVLMPVGRFKPGDVISYLDLQECVNAKVAPVLVGVKYLVKYRQDFLQAFAMESQTTYVPRAIVSSRYDNLNDPIMRTALGLRLE